MSITAYCGRLKELADNLRELGSPLSNPDLVVILLSGLNDKFASCISTISASNPPMTFLQAQSFLLQEEAWIVTRAQKAASTAMLAAARSVGAPSNAPTTGSATSTPTP